MSSTFVPVGTEANEILAPDGAPLVYPPISIGNDGFAPSLALADFRDAWRVDQTITEGRACAAILAAMHEVNADIAAWREAKIIAGYATLADVPAPTIGEVHAPTHHYTRAVFARAKGALVRNYRDYDTTRSGHDRADEMGERVDDYLQVSREAVRRLIGTPRATIELI